MTDTPDRTLPVRDPTMPSDLELDRLLAGELTGADKARVEALVAASPRAQAIVAKRRAGFSEGFDADAAFERIVDAVGDAQIPTDVQTAIGQNETADSRPGLWEWLTAGWGLRAIGLGVAVAAAAIFFVVTRGPDVRDDIVRPKGGLGLIVHQQHGDRSAIVLDGAELPPGARLRFEVATPSDGHLMIVGVEADGALAVGFPQDGAGESASVAAAANLLLPGAIALDESLGEEWLHAVFCPEPFSKKALATSGPAGALAIPPGCLIVTQRLLKVAP